MSTTSSARAAQTGATNGKRKDEEAMQPGTKGSPNAKILIIGECYSSLEERDQLPFRGAPGIELEKMLREAGIDPTNCYYTNLINKRPAADLMTSFFYSNEEAKANSYPCIRGLYPRLEILEGLERVEQLIEKLKPTLIIGFGNYCLWGLTESDFGIGNGSKGKRTAGYKVPTGLGNYRGSQLRCRFGDIPFLPTYAPGDCLRNYPWRYLAVHDIGSRSPKAFKNNWEEPERNYIIRPTYDQVLQVLTECYLRAELSKTSILISVDIETVSHHIECIGLAWSEKDALCIPLMCQDNWDGYWPAREEVEILLLLGKLLSHPRVEVVGQNFLYDFQYFWHFHCLRPRYSHDTMLLQHTLYPGTDLNLNHLSSLYCNYHRYWKDDGKDATAKMDDDKRWIYNCRDVVTTYEIVKEQWKVLKYYNLGMQYALQMTRARAALKMMMRGVAVNEKARGKARLAHMEVAQEIENNLMNMMPESVWKQDPKKAPWFRSNQQLMSIFFDQLGVPEVISRKTGDWTVDDDALNKIGRREPIVLPLVKALQDYRSLEAFGQFINMKVSKGDGRMRCSYSPTTETFRYKSSEDVFGTGRNMQNIPVGNEDEA